MPHYFFCSHRRQDNPRFQGKTIAQQFLREPLSAWSISVKNGKFEKVLSVQVSDALPPSRLEAESRPDPNAGKTGGQAWG